MFYKLLQATHSTITTTRKKKMKKKKKLQGAHDFLSQNYTNS